MHLDTIISLRFSRQHMTGTDMSPSELVRYMCAMQAQDYYGALWAVGLRTGKTEAEVIGALERLEIIRTWPQRGTLHFVAPEDASWMTALSAPRLLAGAKRRHEQLELDEKTLVRSKELLATALQGGKRLTRPQMMELLEQAGIGTKGGRGYHMLWYAAQTGLIYIGPMAGKQQTFGLLADLPVKQRKLSREESIMELTQRYFMSHGPATLQDFMWWSGLTATDAKAGLAAADGLISEKIDGREYWLAESGPAKRPPEVLLLPDFDEYLLGYKDRSAQIDADHFDQIVPGGNGIFMPSIAVNGRIVGIWKRTLKKTTVMIECRMFESGMLGDDVVVYIQKAAERYGKFLGLPVSVKFGE